MKNILFVVLALGLPRSSLALEIERKDLEISVGFLRAQPLPQGQETSLAVYSSSFTSFRTASSLDEFNGWIYSNKPVFTSAPDGEQFRYESGSAEFEKQLAYPFIEDRSAGRLLTVWRDKGFEGSKQAIVVWKILGKKLVLETVLDSAQIAAIGGSLFGEMHHIAPKQHLIIGRTAGGDGDQSWGSVWVALWTEPRSLKFLYTTKYLSEGLKQSLVRYEFDRKGLKLNLHELGRTLVDDPSGTKPLPEWRVQKSWTVDVAPLIKQGSSN